jgi:hypothetical protein
VLSVRCGFLLAAAAALLSACGARQAPDDVVPFQGSAVANALVRAGDSWMLPEAKSDDLLYVDDAKGNLISAFSYPGGKLVGEIQQHHSATVAQGMCADTKGDVFVNAMVGNFGHTYEYAHGGTAPIADFEEFSVWVWGCAVDPDTGDLAVASINWLSNPSFVAVYSNGSSVPKTYEDPDIVNYEFCGYDEDGNLFVDGTGSGGEFVFAELPRESNVFTNITLKQYIAHGGQVQWDGRSLAIGTNGTSPEVVYRLAIHGEQGRSIHIARLQGSSPVMQFWIQGHNIIGPEQSANAVGIWKYPSGALIRTIKHVEQAFGAAVSLAD